MMVKGSDLEAVDPNKIAPISMSSIYKVFDNLHMLWMCIWMCPHHITAAHVDHAIGSELEFLETTSRH